MSDTMAMSGDLVIVKSGSLAKSRRANTQTRQCPLEWAIFKINLVDFAREEGDNKGKQREKKREDEKLNSLI